MNFEKLRSGIDRVKLRPTPTHCEDAHLAVPIDDEWAIVSVSRTDGIELRNLRTEASVVLNQDHVHHFISAPSQPDSVRRGFLELAVQLKLDGTSIEVTPILTGPARFAQQPAASEPTDRLWTQAAQQFLKERPPGWEQLVTCEYLDQIIADGKKRLAELESNLVYRRVEVVRQEETFDKIHGLFAEMISIVDRLDPALRQIPSSWGPSGVAGNPSEIKEACDRLRILVDAMVAWEVELYFCSPAEEFEAAYNALRGTVVTVFDELVRVPRELRAAMKIALVTPGPHICEINLKLMGPPQFEKFRKELEKLEGGFRFW
jgi:hypothetical protein